MLSFAVYPRASTTLALTHLFSSTSGPVILGLFIAALAYLEYQRIIMVDWEKLQMISQTGIAWLANAITHISNNIGADHGVSTNPGISNVVPLASSASAGFMLGMARG